MLETFIKRDQFAESADIFVILISVGLDCHFKDFREEIGEIDLSFELIAKVSAYIAWFYPFEDSHEIVENRSNWIFFREFTYEIIDSKLILIQDVIEVEADCNFADFSHDFRYWGASVEVVLEEC